MKNTYVKLLRPRVSKFFVLGLFVSIFTTSQLSAQTIPEYVVGDTLPPEILNRTLRACDGISGGTTLEYELSPEGGGNQLVWLTFFGSW